MRCLTRMLMLGFVGLSLSNCASQSVTDSFCQLYRPIVVAKGDGTIQASQGVKRRLLANELTYRSQCPGGS